MSLNPFKKDPVKKEKTTYYKKIKEEIGNEIREIEKLSDPAVRVVRYKATLEDLAEFYDSGKLGTSNRRDVLAGGTMGTIGGFVTGSAASIVTIIASPFIGLPVVLGIVGGTMLAGATGGAGMGFDRERSKKLRTKYGSVGNARILYKLQATLEKKMEKDIEAIKAQNLGERFHDTFGKEKFSPPMEIPAAKAPVEATPADTQPAVKKLILPQPGKPKGP